MISIPPCEKENSMRRCAWVDLQNPLYVAYHDHEWGVPSYEDAYLFEMLLLESFQAGLSWACVLNKREAFRKAFDDFDCTKISQYTDERVDALMQNRDIIRNRRKITAAIRNAAVFMDIQKEYGSFSRYIWHFTEDKVIRYEDGEIRATSPLSDEISNDLKNRGMSFVGSTIIYAYLQAIGVIYDHEPTCDFYGK